MVRPQHPGWPQKPQAVSDGGQAGWQLQAAGSEPVVLFGFSQGAAMAIEVGLSRPLAGVIGCSGYPHPDWSLTQAPQAPTLLMHGADDAVVPVAAQAALPLKFLAWAASGGVHLAGGHDSDRSH